MVSLKTATFIGLLAALIFAGAMPAAAQDLQILLDPTLGRAMLRSDYRITWYPEQRVAQQPAELEMVQHNLTLTFPIWQDSTDEWTFSGRVRLQDYDTRAILPESFQRFPRELWDIRLGGAYRHKFDNGWIAAVALSIGSASDSPFHSEHELVGRFTGLLRVPSGERNAWLFTLNYGSDQTVLDYNIPVPGIAYQYAPSDRFRAIIGFPFTSVEYKPIESVTLEAFYAPVRRVRARVTWAVFQPLRLYAGFDWDSDNHYLFGRGDKSDQLYYYEKRFTGGVRFDLRHFFAELSGGWAFDRFYFEGEGWSDRRENRIDVHDGPWAAFRLGIRF